MTYLYIMKNKFVVLSVVFFSLIMFTSASRKDTSLRIEEKNSTIFSCWPATELYISNIGSSSPVGAWSVKKNTEYIVWATGMLSNKIICITTVSGGTLVTGGCNDTSFGVNTAVGRILTGVGSTLTIGVRSTCINNEQSNQNSRNYILFN